MNEQERHDELMVAVKNGNGNGKKLDAKWVAVGITALVVSWGAATYLFVTSNDALVMHQEMMAVVGTKSNKADCEDHEEKPAHREQLVVNQHTVGTVERIEKLVRGLAHDAGLKPARIAPLPLREYP